MNESQKSWLFTGEPTSGESIVWDVFTVVWSEYWHEWGNSVYYWCLWSTLLCSSGSCQPGRWGQLSFIILLLYHRLKVTNMAYPNHAGYSSLHSFISWWNGQSLDNCIMLNARLVGLGLFCCLHLFSFFSKLYQLLVLITLIVPHLLLYLVSISKIMWIITDSSISSC